MSPLEDAYSSRWSQLYAREQLGGQNQGWSAAPHTLSQVHCPPPPARAGQSVQPYVMAPPTYISLFTVEWGLFAYPPHQITIPLEPDQ